MKLNSEVWKEFQLSDHILNVTNNNWNINITIQQLYDNQKDT